MMIKTLPGTGLPASVLTIKYFALGGLYDLEHYMYIQLSHFKFACYNKDAYSKHTMFSCSSHHQGKS